MGSTYWAEDTQSDNETLYPKCFNQFHSSTHIKKEFIYADYGSY